MTSSLQHRARIQARNPGQQGLTLIELMIGLLVSSVLVGFVFSINSRLSNAYRAQTEVSQVQLLLRSGHQVIVRDLRSAGFMIPDGFCIRDPVNTASELDLVIPGTAPCGTGGSLAGPIQVVNGPGGGPDAIHMFAADPDVSAVVMADRGGDPTLPFAAAPTPTQVHLNRTAQFTVGDLALVVSKPTVTATSSDQVQIKHRACLVQITAFDDSFSEHKLSFDDAAAPYNGNNNAHCNLDVGNTSIMRPGATVYRLFARAYRIDTAPDRRASGVLQVLDHTAATLQSNNLDSEPWEDLGLGVFDLQFARHYVQPGDAIDEDNDGDPVRDWFSDGTIPANSALDEITVNMVTRTFQQIVGVGQTEPPVINDILNEDGYIMEHNPFGDGVAADGAAVAGTYIYRWSSASIDIRNSGVIQ